MKSTEAAERLRRALAYQAGAQRAHHNLQVRLRERGHLEEGDKAEAAVLARHNVRAARSVRRARRAVRRALQAEGRHLQNLIQRDAGAEAVDEARARIRAGNTLLRTTPAQTAPPESTSLDELAHAAGVRPPRQYIDMRPTRRDQRLAAAVIALAVLGIAGLLVWRWGGQPEFSPQHYADAEWPVGVRCTNDARAPLTLYLPWEAAPSDLPGELVFGLEVWARTATQERLRRVPSAPQDWRVLTGENHSNGHVQVLPGLFVDVAFAPGRSALPEEAQAIELRVTRSDDVVLAVPFALPD